MSPAAGADRILVAGIGNVFLGDDGFGVEVVRRIDAAALPAGVDVADYGIRGVHLAYDLLDGRHPTLVLVDAVPMDEPPGTLAVLEADPQSTDGTGRGFARGEDPEPELSTVDAHGMDPRTVLRLLRDLGGRVDRVLVVGCRPAVVEEHMGLSDAVAAAVDDAARLVADVVRTEAQRRVGRPGGADIPG